jgi:hypothetical protein
LTAMGAKPPPGVPEKEDPDVMRLRRGAWIFLGTISASIIHDRDD